jgi:hypothetical protein
LLRRYVRHSGLWTQLHAIGAATGGDYGGARQAHLEGFDLHAYVWVSANDWAGLERLCRYILRPPFAQERLRRRSDGRIALELKTAWHDGTRELACLLGERQDGGRCGLLLHSYPTHASATARNPANAAASCGPNSGAGRPPTQAAAPRLGQDRDRGAGEDCL